MFNYITVEFPTVKVPAQRVYKFRITQTPYSHEIADVVFRDWNLDFVNVKPGLPVRFTLRSTEGSRVFNGLIYSISPVISPGKNFVSMVVTGASYQLAQTRQRVFSDMTADKVVEQIAKENNFSYSTVPHGRVYPQIAQAGYTDFELMTRLALQCGYTLRVENTSIFFKPINYDYQENQRNAPRFVMRSANDPSGSTLYSFEAVIGETIKYPTGYKSRINVLGMSTSDAGSYKVTSSGTEDLTNTVAEAETFDYYMTHTVAPTLEVAKFEAEAGAKRNKYPYRAKVTVIGSPSIRPDFPVYLEGIGGIYSGYWIVLSATHEVVEESVNKFRFVTYLEIGTDSLGSARVFDDNSIVVRPITQSKSEFLTQQSQLSATSSFYNLSNYANVTIDKTGAVFKTPTWVSGAVDLDAKKKYVNRPPEVVKRLERVNASICGS